MPLIEENIAYLAMFEFLSEFYRQTKSDDVGALLGGMALLEDGSTADAGALSAWNEALKKAREDDVDATFRIVPTTPK